MIPRELPPSAFTPSLTMTTRANSTHLIYESNLRLCRIRPEDLMDPVEARESAGPERRSPR